MVRQKITRIALYRYRYVFAYAMFAVALAVMLLIAGFYLPGGLTDTEMRSALISDNLNPAMLFSLQPDQLIYLPYRLLQAGSVSLFGMSLLGIKLPSILLGFFASLGILYLLNLWYRRNVAIIAALIAVTTNIFLLSAQAGQAGIAYIFLTTMILIAASMITRRSAYARIWVIAGASLAAISLYLPLNAYILIALLLTALFHPHARHVLFKQAPRSILALATLVFIVIISPLIVGIVNEPSILRTLLGFSESVNNFGANASALLQNYTSFSTPVSSEVIAPVYGLGLVLMIALGLYRLFSAKYTARSYILSIWLLLLVPLVCLNPGFVSITFIPVVLLIALSVEYLIRSWYRLFPHNPYARIFGLVPLGVLVVGLLVSSVDRYIYGLHYDRAVYDSYSYDLPILTNELRSLDKNDEVLLVVSQENAEFYESFARHQDYVKRLSISTDSQAAMTAPIAIVERTMKDTVNKTPDEIFVTRTTDNADRFYLYNNS